MLTFCGCDNELRLITTTQLDEFVISDGTSGIKYVSEESLGNFYDHVRKIFVKPDRFKEQENGNNYYGEMVFKVTVLASRDRMFRFDIVKVGDGNGKKYYIQKIYNKKYYLSEEMTQELIDYFNYLYYGNTIVID